MTFYERWRDLRDQCWTPSWDRQKYLTANHLGDQYEPGVEDRYGREGLRMGIDALEAYANAGDDYVNDGAGIFNDEAEDAIQAATEFFQAAADSFLQDEGLT